MRGLKFPPCNPEDRVLVLDESTDQVIAVTPDQFRLGQLRWADEAFRPGEPAQGVVVERALHGDLSEQIAFAAEWLAAQQQAVSA